MSKSRTPDERLERLRSYKLPERGHRVVLDDASAEAVQAATATLSAATTARDALRRRAAGAPDTDLSEALAQAEATVEEAVAQLEAAHRQLEERSVLLTLRALPAQSSDPEQLTWSSLLEAHPPRRANEQFNPETFPPALLSASIVDVSVPVEEFTSLLGRMSFGDGKQLFSIAWDLNTRPRQLPAAPVLRSLEGV